MKRKKYNFKFKPCKGKSLKSILLMLNVKKIPLETNRQVKKRSILYFHGHYKKYNNYLDRKEYQLITETTYYAFWKFNKCCRQLMNVIIQEMKRAVKEIKHDNKRS